MIFNGVNKNAVIYWFTTLKFFFTKSVLHSAHVTTAVLPAITPETSKPQKFVSHTFGVCEVFIKLPEDMVSGEVLLEHSSIGLGTRHQNQHQFKEKKQFCCVDKYVDEWFQDHRCNKCNNKQRGVSELGLCTSGKSAMLLKCYMYIIYLWCFKLSISVMIRKLSGTKTLEKCLLLPHTCGDLFKHLR